MKTKGENKAAEFPDTAVTAGRLRNFYKTNRYTDKQLMTHVLGMELGAKNM